MPPSLSIQFPSSFFLLCCALVGYLLGSIPSGLILARVFVGADVRHVGSGHTGGLNTFRAAGLGPAVLTVIADVGKAIAAVEFGHWLITGEWGAAIAGVMVTVGHCWPIYARFEGGMGLMTTSTVLLRLAWPVLPMLMLIWFPVQYLVKNTPLALMIVALLLPLAMLLVHADFPAVAFGLGAGAVLFIRHLGVWRQSRRQFVQ